MILSGRQRNDSPVEQQLSLPILFPYCFYIKKIKISLNSETLLAGRKTFKDCISKVFEFKQLLIYRPVFNMQSVSRKIACFHFFHSVDRILSPELALFTPNYWAQTKLSLFFIFSDFSPPNNQTSNVVWLFQIYSMQDLDIAMKLSYQK